MYLNFVILRDESFILDAFISIAYSRLYIYIYIHAVHYSLIPSYFRIAPCDEGIGLPCRVQARVRAMCIYRYTRPGLSLITCLPGGRDMKLLGYDCCHGYRAYTELSTDKRIR